MNKINWLKTLNNIIWKHKYNTIEFTIKDVEELHNYMQQQQLKLESAQDNIKKLSKDNDFLRIQILASSLKKPVDKIETFITYA